jgi:hypothetical protein
MLIGHIIQLHPFNLARELLMSCWDVSAVKIKLRIMTTFSLVDDLRVEINR